MGILILAVLIFAVMYGYGSLGERWRVAIRSGLRFGLILGGIGFAAGFFGPMVFAPGANQGPLLGIFITGPGGFVLGLAYGILRAVLRPA